MRPRFVRLFWRGGGDEDPLACREFVELVTDYLEDALPRPVRRRFERHMRACPHCPRHVEAMRTTLRIIGSLSEDMVEPAAIDELLVAFRGWREE